MFLSASFDLFLHSIPTDNSEKVESIQIEQFQSKIIKVSVCNDNSYLALLRENEKPQILSTKEKDNFRVIQTINVSNISTLVFKHSTKKNIALGTKTGDVLMYDTKSKNVSHIYSKISENIKDLEFSCNDQQLCGFDRTFLFIFPNILTNNQLKKFKLEAECRCLKCHPYLPDRMALGFIDGHIEIWNLQNWTSFITVETVNNPINGLAMSSCGNFLIAASGKCLKICGFDSNDNSCIFHYTIDEDSTVLSMDLSLNDRYLCIGTIDGTLKIYDIKTQLKLISTIKLHSSPINFIKFENKSKEQNSNFSSVLEMKDTDSVVSKKTTKTHHSISHPDDGLLLDKMKKNFMKIIKFEMDCLENQLNEHCNKFQKFLDNEFETIDSAIKMKWDIFNGGNMDQIIKAICPEEEKKQ